jgi:hypothetical protein
MWLDVKPQTGACPKCGAAFVYQTGQTKVLQMCKCDIKDYVAKLLEEDA